MSEHLDTEHTNWSVVKRWASGSATMVAAVAVMLGAAPTALAHEGSGPCKQGTIVFTRFGDDGIPNLFAVDACGAQARQLTTTGAHHADVSADGLRLAYDTIPTGQTTTDVFVGGADGAGARDVTNSPATNDIEPDLSPSGDFIAYSSGTNGERDARIVVQNLRSGHAHAITPVVAGQEAFDPSWSPSGRWIVFDVFAGGSGTSSLWMVRSDGRALRRLTDDAADACQPDWGPDDRIAYAGGCDQLQSHLFLRDPAGRHVQRLTSDADGGSSQLPAFSPDGRSLTFSRFDAAFTDGDVWRLDLASGAQSDLVPGPTLDFWSVWGGSAGQGE
jgi:Tol biopolymer transport system component